MGWAPPIRYALQVRKDLIAARLARVEGLVAAYLFGSQARGTASAASDVDVALLLTSAPKTLDDLQLDVAADLERELGLPVDVVVLNHAPSDLIHRVLRDGELLVENDRSARIRFEVRARNDYFDLAPVRHAYRRGRRSAPA
ncbi:MAG: polymerase subunit beta [Labilithrix sp.]|nr:polymerase subunit beta [Labilithrix sp.]